MYLLMYRHFNTTHEFKAVQLHLRILYHDAQAAATPTENANRVCDAVRNKTFGLLMEYTQ